MKKVMIAFSGGLDSTVLLAKALCDGYDALTVSFKYPAKNNKRELKAAKLIAERYLIQHMILDVTKIIPMLGCALTDPGIKIPEGSYKQDEMKVNIVPCRNLIFGSILSGVCEHLEISELWLGTHQGDDFINAYPDCRTSFLKHFAETIMMSTEGKVRLSAPLQDLSKTEIILMGMELNVPFDLTETCFSGDRFACGKCGACVGRLKAFDETGFDDPLNYQDRGFWKTVSMEGKQ